MGTAHHSFDRSPHGAFIKSPHGDARNNPGELLFWTVGDIDANGKTTENIHHYNKGKLVQVGTNPPPGGAIQGLQPQSHSWDTTRKEKKLYLASPSELGLYKYEIEDNLWVEQGLNDRLWYNGVTGAPGNEQGQISLVGTLSGLLYCFRHGGTSPIGFDSIESSTTPFFPPDFIGAAGFDGAAFIPVGADITGAWAFADAIVTLTFQAIDLQTLDASGAIFTYSRDGTTWTPLTGFADANEPAAFLLHEYEDKVYLYGTLNGNRMVTWTAGDGAYTPFATSGGAYTMGTHKKDLIIAGDFTSFEGVPANNIIKWNAIDGFVAMGDGLGKAGEYVNKVLTGPDGKLYAGGSFTEDGNGNQVRKLAVWESSTETWKEAITGLDGTTTNVTDMIIYKGKLPKK